MSVSRERLEEISKINDIDYSDIPKITEEQFARAKPCHLVNKEMWKPRKKVLSIRIDADILSAIKHSGAGWQTRLNDYLRQGVARGQL